MRILLFMPLLAGCVVYHYQGGDLGFVSVTRRAAGVGRAYRHLVEAAEAAPMRELPVASLGVTREQIRAAVGQWAASIAPNAMRRFAEQVSSSESVRRYAAQGCIGWQSTNRMTYRVRLWTGRGPITLTSESEGVLHLPWKVTRGKRSFETCNPEIQRALFELFHDDSGFMPGGLPVEIVEMAEPTYVPELKTNEAAEVLGDQLDPLRRRFQLGAMEIFQRTESFNSNWTDRRQPGVLSVLLTTQELGRVRLRALLPVRDARIDPAPFLASYDEVVRQLGAVNWLGAFLDSHPRAQATVEVDGSELRIELVDGDRRELWSMHPNGRCRLEGVGEIRELEAVQGDWLTPEGRLEAGPGHLR